MATEFMGTSISSEGNPTQPSTRYELPGNPHIIFHNNNRGYVRCTLTPDHWTSEYRIVDTVLQLEAKTTRLATFAIENGLPGAELATTTGV